MKQKLPNSSTTQQPHQCKLDGNATVNDREQIDGRGGRNSGQAAV